MWTPLGVHLCGNTDDCFCWASDLRFPAWARNDKKNPYDLVLYVANWPEPRISAWSALLKARAIENASYCAGLNRIGKDGIGLNYIGKSAVYDHYGNTVLEMEGEEDAPTITLSKNNLEAYRKKFPVLKDADDFKFI